MPARIHKAPAAGSTSSSDSLLAGRCHVNFGVGDCAGYRHDDRAADQLQTPPLSADIIAHAVWLYYFLCLNLTLADFGGVSECIFHALPDMARNLYTVSARPGHERNLMRPYFTAYGCDRVAECHDRFWIPCGGSGLKLS